MEHLLCEIPRTALALPDAGRVYGSGSDCLIHCGEGQGSTLFSLTLPPIPHPRPELDLDVPTRWPPKGQTKLDVVEELVGVGVKKVVSGFGRLGVVTPGGDAYIFSRGKLEPLDVDIEGEVEDLGLGSGFEVVVIDGRAYGRGDSECFCLCTVRLSMDCDEGLFCIS